MRTVFEQCPSLAWDLHSQILKCFLVKDIPKKAAATEDKKSDSEDDPMTASKPTEESKEGSRSNHQRLQAIELYQLLIKVA